jgi:hypothetical protein
LLCLGLFDGRFLCLGLFNSRCLLNRSCSLSGFSGTIGSRFGLRFLLGLTLRRSFALFRRHCVIYESGERSVMGKWFVYKEKREGGNADTNSSNGCWWLALTPDKSMSHSRG